MPKPLAEDARQVDDSAAPYHDLVEKYFFLAMRTCICIIENGVRRRPDMDVGSVVGVSIGLLAIWVMMISAIVGVWSARNRF